MADAPLLFWDFENVMSDRGVSVAVGVPTDPALVSGFVSQTGGGPSEVFGSGVGTVFLTRHLGTNDVFLWFTLTRPAHLAGLTFRHWHNHNPGYPTCPRYRVQLQLDSGDGYENVGEPLELCDDNSGGTDTVAVGRDLEPGGYKMRWHPKGLKGKARDTSSEFLAFKNLALNGHALAGAPRAAEVHRAPAAPCPSGDGYVDIEIAGVLVDGMKVMGSKFGGKCARTGGKFEAGARIAFKHRDALSAPQKATIFGTKKPTHLAVLISPADCTTADGAPVPDE
ncbi:MAG: hypothetical protein FJ304_10320 [Planctomycetes bacterium]|nr:hypothetical protein [Planctomycetota bacterium]